MNMFIELTKRNIKLYWRDKSTVFFSLLSAIIIIALFVLFLGRLYIDGTIQSFSQHTELDKDSVRALIFSWILSGIIVLNSISIPQMMLSRTILDREDNITNDFYVIPFKRSILGLSYIASAIIVGTVITYISFIAGELYIFSISGELYSVGTHFIVLLVILLCTSSFSALMFLIYLFVKNSSTIGGISAFTSSVGGFLAGIYISIGNLSGLTKDLISANPLAHATTLIRNILMNDFMATVFQNAPEESVNGFADSMAINLYVGSTQLHTIHFILSLILLAVISSIISYFKLFHDKM